MAKPKKNKYKVNIRLDLPPNKRHKSIKDYDRKKYDPREEDYDDYRDDLARAVHGWDDEEI